MLLSFPLFFLKLNFLVVDMFNACVLYLSKNNRTSTYQKRGCARSMRTRVNPPQAITTNITPT